jgi:hypothetical protein
MGLAYHGTCYQSQAQAIEAFKADYPLHQAANVYYLSSAVADGASGVKFTTRTETGTASITDGIVQFAACDASTSGFSAIPLQSILFLLAIFFAAAIGFYNGWSMKK